MPTYEYRCASCDSTFSLERSRADRRKRARCVVCHSYATALVPSLCGFTLSGGGWAAAGYASTKGSSAGKT